MSIPSCLEIFEKLRSEKAQVAEKEKNLQDLHTRRRDLLLMIDKRLESAQYEDDMNQLTYRLYKLTKEEIRLVERG